MKLLKAILYTLPYLIVLSSYPQTIDPGFNLPTPVKAADTRVVRIQQDGKILLGGSIQFYENQRVNNLVRLNEDGSLDESLALSLDSKGSVNHIELLGSGEIIISEFNRTTNCDILTKLSDSGKILISNDSLGDIKSICIQNDDKILITASRFKDGALAHRLHRFNSDFTLDDTFNQNNRFKDYASDIAMQGDSILVAASFSDNAFADSKVIRFAPNGSLDPSFSDESDLDWIDEMTVQPDGKILLSNIVRLNADGSVDAGFNPPKEVERTVSPPILQGSDILTVGHPYSDSEGTFLRRLKADGSLDANFVPVRLRDGFCNACLALTTSDEIIMNDTPLGGNEYGLTKFSKDGLLDESFRPEVGTYGEISFGDYKSGQLVVGGDFVRIGEVRTRNLAKINADGTVDAQFVAAPSLSAYPVMSQQPSDVKIIDSNTYLAALGKSMLRLNERGEIMEQYTYTRSGFTVPLNFSEKINLLPDGRIVTASVNGIVVLNSDGTVDSSFVIPKPNGRSTLYDFDIQSDGFLWGTNFTQVNGIDANGWVRLNYDGTVDQTFNVGSGANDIVTNINVLENDNIIITGRFSQFNGVAARRLVKLFKGGQVDKEFTKNYSATTPEYYFSFSSNSVNTNFRDGFIISARDWYGYTLSFLKNDGTFDSNYRLPDKIESVEEEIFPVVTNSDSIILFSKFQINGNSTPSFALRLIFNSKPTITGTTSSLVTLQETPISLSLDDLIVTDVDNTYPTDFTLSIYDGDNYSLDGFQVIPSPGFVGKLNIPVKVSDGTNESDLFYFTIEVVAEDQITALEDTIASNNVYFYPNPVDEELNVEVNDWIGGTISIASVSGKHIWTKQIVSPSMTIDLESVNSGVYLLRLIKEEQTYIFRVVKL